MPERNSSHFMGNVAQMILLLLAKKPEVFPYFINTIFFVSIKLPAFN
jgi:hypothetical protein